MVVVVLKMPLTISLLDKLIRFLAVCSRLATIADVDAFEAVDAFDDDLSLDRGDF